MIKCVGYEDVEGNAFKCPKASTWPRALSGRQKKRCGTCAIKQHRTFSLRTYYVSNGIIKGEREEKEKLTRGELKELAHAAGLVVKP